MNTAAVLLAAGAEVDMPTLVDARARFDVGLSAALDLPDDSRASVLRRALGV